MFGCSIKHSFETERQFPVILLIAKFWQFSSLRHKVEQVNASLEKKKYYSLSIDFFSIAHGGRPQTMSSRWEKGSSPKDDLLHK